MEGWMSTLSILVLHTLNTSLPPSLCPSLPSPPSGMKTTTSSFPSTRAGAEGERNSVLVAAGRPGGEGGREGRV